MEPVRAAIDLNVDVGEVLSDDGRRIDASLISWATTAHIAAGGHAGDVDSMRLAIDRCCEAGVVVGGHPSYPDRVRFGRARSSMSMTGVIGAVLEQLFTLAKVAQSFGRAVESVKPHGQLYHDLEVDQELAEAFFEAVANVGTVQRVVLQCGSRCSNVALNHGIELIAEGFCDRRYRDGRIVPRAEDGAVLREQSRVTDQALELAMSGLTIDGRQCPVDSLCLHSDSVGAADFIISIRKALEHANISIRAPRA